MTSARDPRSQVHSFLKALLCTSTLLLGQGLVSEPSLAGVKYDSHSLKNVTVVIKGKSKAYGSVQEAIDSVKESDAAEITVGAGSWKERVEIRKKNHLTLNTMSQAKLNGMEMENSDYVTVSGFVIEPSSAQLASIAILGFENHVQHVELNNIVAHNALGLLSGAGVAALGQVDLKIIKSTLSSNSLNGLFVLAEGSVLVDGCEISGNGLNGMSLASDALVTVKNSTLKGNGTLGLSDEGYGINKLAYPGLWWAFWLPEFMPERVTLLDNVIVYNKGRVVAGSSSLDLKDIKAIFNKANEPSGAVADARNQTTSGLEFAGATVPYRPAGSTVVPKLVGLTEADARTSLASAKLTVKAVATAYSNSVMATLVLDQSPAPGTSGKEGDAVSFTVSLGLPVVPSIVGSLEADARQALSKAGFSAGLVTSSYNATVAKGVVTSQNPAANSLAPTTTPIAFDVSKGPDLVVVPQVVGLTETAAQAQLASVGLIVTRVESFSDTAAAQSVIAASPTSGQSVLRGSSVLLTISKGMRLMSDLSGKTQVEAAAALQADGFSLGTVSFEYSDSIAKDTIFKQSPLSGVASKSGTAVAVTISKGPLATVPTLVGTSQSAGVSALQASGLVAGAVQTVYSDTIAAGQIISQTVAAGTRVEPGSAVGFSVSQGAMPTVPSIVGLTQPAAIQAITGAGLTVGLISTAYDDTVIFGSVTVQNPTATTRVPSQTAVNFTTSLGPEKLNVPSVIGMTEANAKAYLVSLGFAVGAIATDVSNQPIGTIIAQSPVADVKVSRGTPVNLVTSKGQPLVSVPDLVGKSDTAARSLILSAGLLVGSVSKETSSTIAPNTIISQSPSSGSSVNKGSSINFVISLGPEFIVQEPSGTPVEQEHEFLQCLSDNPVAASSFPTGVQPSFYDSVSFIFNGGNARQLGVTAGKIDATRPAVLWGRVRKSNGEALVGVKVSVAGDSAYGYAITNECGAYYLVTNGGAGITLNFEMSDFISAQRTVLAASKDYTRASNVILIPLSSNATTIDLSSLTEPAVVQGSLITDEDGTRQATVMFPVGTTAQVAHADGTFLPLSTFSLRATEFTVGKGGPEAMPAKLPEKTAYTYAVDLSVDGVDPNDSVLFSSPVFFYLEAV